MDPASASIAVIGLAASLTTLAALVIDSCKTMYTVRAQLRNAPKDIQRLSRGLKEFEDLVCGLRDIVRAQPSGHAASILELAFENSTEQMHRDMVDFEIVIQRLKGLLDTSTSPGKILALRIRHILNESAVQKYQHLISSHVGTLTLLLGMLNK